MSVHVEITLKLQTRVDYYINHGPSTCVVKELITVSMPTALHDQPLSSPDKGNGVPVSVQ
jgi:hypothetical protein